MGGQKVLWYASYKLCYSLETQRRWRCNSRSEAEVLRVRRRWEGGYWCKPQSTEAEEPRVLMYKGKRTGSPNSRRKSEFKVAPVLVLSRFSADWMLSMHVGWGWVGSSSIWFQCHCFWEHPHGCIQKYCLSAAWFINLVELRRHVLMDWRPSRVKMLII
jgi:hypothetical protein